MPVFTDKIDLEIEKLEKLKNTIILSLNVLSRDKKKMIASISALKQELNDLESHLKNLRSNDNFLVISLTDYKRITSQIVDIKERLERQDRQLVAILNFTKISTIDLEKCMEDLATLTNAKNYEAEVINLFKHE
jgi:type II secretory pathway component GspD/PulD (secretin)